MKFPPLFYITLGSQYKISAKEQFKRWDVMFETLDYNIHAEKNMDSRNNMPFQERYTYVSPPAKNSIVYPSLSPVLPFETPSPYAFSYSNQTDTNQRPVSPPPTKDSKQPPKLEFKMPDVKAQRYVLEDYDRNLRTSAKSPYIPPPIPLNSVKTIPVLRMPGYQQSNRVSSLVSPERKYKNPSLVTKAGAATIFVGQGLSYAAQKSILKN